MKYEPKIIKSDIKSVIDSMYKDWYTLVQYIEWNWISIWHRPIIQTRTKKPDKIPESQLLYNPVVWTHFSPKKYCPNLRHEDVMKKYLQFRQARWEKRKDLVSQLWEKKMFNIHSQKCKF